MPFLPIVVILIAALSLSGCKTLEQHQKRAAACDELTLALAETDEWKQSCLKDDEVFGEGFRRDVASWNKSKLCMTRIVYQGEAVGTVAQEAVDRRGLECKTEDRMMAKDLVDTADVGLLCYVWYNNIGSNEYKNVVNKGVKDKGVNCASVVALEAQTAAAEAQAEAASSQAAAAWSAAISASRPVSTNCTSYGYSTNCTSY